MEKKTKFSIWYVMIAIWGILFLQNLFFSQFRPRDISYSEFLQKLEAGKIVEVSVQKDKIFGKMLVDENNVEKTVSFDTVRVDLDLSRKLAQYNVKFRGEPESTFLLNLFSWIFPTLLFFGLWYLLMKKIAAEGYKVLLSGEGSDELFLGYRQYFEYLDIEKAASLHHKNWLRKYFHSHFSMNREWEWYKRIFDDTLLFRSSGEKFTDLQQNLLLRRNVRDNESLRFLAPYREMFDASGHEHPAQWYTMIDLKLFVGEHFLAKLDRVSMAHTIEGRTPFLDHRLAETLLSIDPAVRIGGGETKSLLRRVARSYLSDAIINRKKKGFSNPYMEWLVASGRIGLIREVNRQTGLFNTEIIDLTEKFSARNYHPLPVVIATGGDERLLPGDVLVLVGRDKDLDEVGRLLNTVIVGSGAAGLNCAVRLFREMEETGVERPTDQIAVDQIPQDLDALYRRAIASRPELHAALATIQRDRANVDMARLNYFPDVTLGMTWIDTSDAGLSPVIRPISPAKPVTAGAERVWLRYDLRSRADLAWIVGVARDLKRQKQKERGLGEELEQLAKPSFLFREYAQAKAGVSVRDDDEFYRIVGNFVAAEGPYSANEQIRRQARALFPGDREQQDAYIEDHIYTGNDAWRWDSEEERDRFKSMRNSSLDAYHRANLTLGLLVANRLLSVLDVGLISARSRSRGPDRPGDDHPRTHQRQHGHRPGNGRGRQGLPVHARDAGHDERGAPEAAGRLRRRIDPDARQRRHEGRHPQGE